MIRKPEHILEYCGAIEHIVGEMKVTQGGVNKRQVECQDGILRNVSAIRRVLKEGGNE